MSQTPTITRADLERAIGADRLDELLAEPYRRDDPDVEVRMAERLQWALQFGVSELALVIDLSSYAALEPLYREYAAGFAVFHLRRTTSAGATQSDQEYYDEVHKNLAMAHKGERLPGEREQRATARAEVIEDETPWSSAGMKGFV